MSEISSTSDPKPPVEPGPPPTPFDHPLFLPILLLAGVLWFGYDGWINTDPEMVEHQDFNRYGFGVLVLLCGWFGYKGWNEWQEDRAAAAKASSPGENKPEGGTS
ncbi:MAG: hypothetical protein P8Q97_12060 [Myxococcota bacterium]|jgi:hypothetical protein|nr:hypothetical protein [Myxococcota bacterium]